MGDLSISFTLRILLAILSTYRLARLFTLEDGPGLIFTRLRIRLAARGVFFSTLLSCPLCLGVWIAFAVTPFVFWQSWVLIPFAIAGGQCALETMNNEERGARDE
jgi:hypothetical protein